LPRLVENDVFAGLARSIPLILALILAHIAGSSSSQPGGECDVMFAFSTLDVSS
jgi:hypothetical protein